MGTSFPAAFRSVSMEPAQGRFAARQEERLGAKSRCSQSLLRRETRAPERMCLMIPVRAGGTPRQRPQGLGAPHITHDETGGRGIERTEAGMRRVLPGALNGELASCAPGGHAAA